MFIGSGLVLGMEFITYREVAEMSELMDHLLSSMNNTIISSRRLLIFK